MALSPLQLEEEVLLVKESMIIPVILDVLDRDIHTISTVKLKFPHLYASKLREIQKDVTKKQYALKRDLRSRGIKIFELQRTKTSLNAQYLCRGYEHNMVLLWDLVRAEIELTLAAYLKIHLEEDGD